MPLIATRGAASVQGFGEFAQQTAVNYIEDVFSTYLYTGNGSTQTITNGIDLSTKGGLVWIKSRGSAVNHALADTVRGANNRIASNTQAAQIAGGVTAFNTNGFNIDNEPQVNSSSTTYVSWSLREQPKFFDIVTYTGNGSNRTIAHNLGSVPGCIIIKRTDAIEDWQVYHRSLANTQYMVLDQTFAAITGLTRWNSTTPTDTVFSLGTSTGVNASGGTYIAYIFAHDAGGFGLTGTDNVITCGSFTTNSSGFANVNLGYEPQWVMFKSSSSTTTGWEIYDQMRGWNTTGGTRKILIANTSAAETSADQTTYQFIPTSTGFTFDVNVAGYRDTTFIYIAIRRGPMKVPTTGTSVFTPVSNTSPTTGNLTDLTINRQPTSTQSTWAISRLTNAGLETQSTNAETSTSSFIKFDVMTGVNNNGWLTNSNSIWWNFKRAPSFFDEVCYTGTGSATTVSHNLAAVPELIFTKRRDNGAFAGRVYHKDLGSNYWLYLFYNVGDAVQGPSSSVWNGTNPTASVFSVGTDAGTNASGSATIAYLFATCAGVSKVGSYTGTGALQTVNCGFTSGARFVLIKRTDSTGDWWTYDSARGISSGNDPYFLLNSTAAEVTNTNYVDTDTTGFKVTAAAPAGLNATGGTYIFLAIA